MRPNKKTRTLAYIVATLLCALALWNCGNNSQASSSENIGGETATVALKLKYSDIPLLDSLVLDCFGVDTLHLVHSADDGNFKMDLFPSEHWSFKAKLYANGALMQMGELETKLEAGTNVNLSIQMHALVGFVYIDIPLGLHNDAGIKGGLMTLKSQHDTLSIPMEQSASSGIFKSGMLKLDESYDIEISLYDADGVTIYNMVDNFFISEDSPIPHFTIQSLRSQVAIAIQLANEQNIELTLPLPAAYRTPKAGDILLTEVFSAPDSKDSNQYEFVEIYNGSIDTLSLSGCSLGVTSSSSTKFVPLTIDEIFPGEVIVLGNVNSANTPDENINTESWYDMANSKGSTIIKCNGTTLDSLYYASELDSLHTSAVPALGASKYGSSAQLDIEKWQSKEDPSAWCLGSPTPGTLSFCN